MKILVVSPYNIPEVREIDGSLESMQDVVGGFIELLCLRDGTVVVCNEEGKLMGMPPCAPVYDPVDGHMIDIICGTFFFCADGCDGELIRLPEDKIVKYTQMYTHFVRTTYGEEL